jgi:type II secretory pathway component GspD/PulD (secretin)
MRTTLLSLPFAVLLLATGCDKRSARSSIIAAGPPTFSSFDQSTPSGTPSGGAPAPLPAHAIRFVDVDIAPVLALYQEISGRSVIRSASLPTTNQFTFDNATPLTRVEALQALDNVLAANNVVMVYLGTKYVKAVPAREAHLEPGPVIDLPPEQLPESSSYLTYIVKLKHITIFDANAALTPHAKLPNSVIGMRDSDVLILRDYSANVKRMLLLLEEIDRGPGFKKTAEQMFDPKGKRKN